MGKHTTGPWHAANAPDGWCVSRDGDKYRIATVQTNLNRARSGEVEANARLIAAAPDLLALSDLVTVYQIEGDDAVHINVCGVKIGAFGQSTHSAAALLRYEADRRATIAKATGESTT